MGFPHKGHYDIAVGGFIQKHFRVARSDHLTTLQFRRLRQYPIDLSLPQDLEVGVWFVQQQD